MGDAAVAQANATLDIVHEIATILDTGLSKEEVAIIIALIENGVNPQASLPTCEGPDVYYCDTERFKMQRIKWLSWLHRVDVQKASRICNAPSHRLQTSERP